MGRYGPIEVLSYDERRQVEEDAELRELALLLEEYEKLLDNCYKSVMSAEDNHRLNGLYSALSALEESHWLTAAPWLAATLQQNTDSDFPMILFKLGLLPRNN